MVNYSKRILPIIVLGVSIFACKQNQEPVAVGMDERPNIIVILSDDMGYSDISPYGGEIHTPNLQRMADNGLLFTQFYNTARCCPTRASLLTGCYPQETGIGLMTQPPGNPEAENLGVPQYQGYLNKETVTIAEVLKTSGYRTMMTGKWHLGYEKKEYWPKQRGFDDFYGIVAGAGNFFKPEYPRGIVSGNDTITVTGEDFYTTDAFTDQAINFIGENNAKPFFLYLAYNAPHWPLQAPKKVVDKYRGKYREGWHKLRKERYSRMKNMGLISEDWELPIDDVVEWDSLSEEKKDEMDHRMAIYAAMVDRMDQNIGKLLDSLESRKLLDNTVIMFLNDNGACAEGGMLGWGDKDLLGTKEGYYLSYGKAWANVSNTPYREYKHWVHEGGIATPFILHWPNGLKKEQEGSCINEYGFLPDVMATCLDLAKAEYPKEYRGYKITPMSGKSLVPLLSKSNQPIHTEPIFWEHQGNRAVRIGDYKIVQYRDRQGARDWELYNLKEDRTETNDLVARMPEKMEELKRHYYDWAERIGVLPWDEVQRIKKENKNKKAE